MAILLIFLSVMIPVFHLNIKNIIGRKGNDGTKNTEIWVPVTYLSNFWRTLDMLLINGEIDLILPWSENSILISGGIDNQVPTFAITWTKCSSCNFIDTRKCKTIASIKIRF